MMTSETTLMTVPETAAYLRASRATVYRLIASGQLPALKVGGRFRIDRDELDEYVYGAPKGVPGV